MTRRRNRADSPYPLTINVPIDQDAHQTDFYCAVPDFDQEPFDHNDPSHQTFDQDNYQDTIEQEQNVDDYYAYEPNAHQTYLDQMAGLNLQSDYEHDREFNPDFNQDNNQPCEIEDTYESDSAHEEADRYKDFETELDTADQTYSTDHKACTPELDSYNTDESYRSNSAHDERDNREEFETELELTDQEHFSDSEQSEQELTANNVDDYANHHNEEHLEHKFGRLSLSSGRHDIYGSTGNPNQEGHRSTNTLYFHEKWNQFFHEYCEICEEYIDHLYSYYYQNWQA